MKIMTYRGHIRNWEALSRELAIDCTGMSREEREEALLLKAYEQWGTDMAMHLYGMFALAIWDAQKQELFCVRDHFGTKPFYYYLTQDHRLLYGTYIRDILDKPGFVKELNKDMLQIYMSLTYV
ncbi:MAG: asparagine synthetase B, partial [Oscillospiraceae bacterium]|nr:asparagine synthetase B [Oscillospiraceae bacterium]